MDKELDVKRERVDLCWYVGACIDDVNKVDEFIKNGVWINGYKEKYLDIVKSIKVGDRIAIKASYTQKKNLPFDINGRTASVMEIKAIGVVIKNYNDGRNLEVDWKRLVPSKKWYFYTFRNTVCGVYREHHNHSAELLDFTFADKPQNYSTFLSDQSFVDKYFVEETSEESEYINKTEAAEDTYTRFNFLAEVYITESEYDKLLELIKYKKNIILQGAPGVGKTFTAKRLAYSIMGVKDKERVECVQFHQSYSYEDFIEGLRPVESGGFKLQSGVFKMFCKRASEDKENDYFFIIDEINRGNMSKIFGELLMLIEADKRGDENSVKLVYSGEPFSVPENVYIIGMMNTADRSLAMIDYALRRRFAFYTMKPAFDSTGFKAYARDVQCELFHKAVDAVKSLNNVIRDDKSLGVGFEIGHSFFCFEKNDAVTAERVKNILIFEIIPTIEEYWFDNETELFTQRERLLRLVSGIDGDL